ncbi:MAG TPA: hypothetical protein VE197_14255 [Mycobacterium sp.]|nr:hypothetical protein [Mycobacterium sp.]
MERDIACRAPCPLSIIVIANDVFVSTNSRTTAYLVALTIHSGRAPPPIPSPALPPQWSG